MDKHLRLRRKDMVANAMFAKRLEAVKSLQPFPKVSTWLAKKLGIALLARFRGDGKYGLLLGVDQIGYTATYKESLFTITVSDHYDGLRHYFKLTMSTKPDSGYSGSSTLALYGESRRYVDSIIYTILHCKTVNDLADMLDHWVRGQRPPL